MALSRPFHVQRARAAHLFAHWFGPFAMKLFLAIIIFGALFAAAMTNSMNGHTMIGVLPFIAP